GGMVRKALGILAASAALVFAIAVSLRGQSAAWSHGLLWGAPGGLICAASAVGIALWAERRGLAIKQALAAVVVGMLFRMSFLAGWTLIAVLGARAHAVAFLAGFGGVYLVGQILEVWLLTRLRIRQDGRSDAPQPS
ncbi:MAG TPA: hypothetical protein VKY51_06910, partial [Fredinandcohnia sp.]|nr:hypothetical protein [Fredinandcohnia sp.]